MTVQHQMSAEWQPPQWLYDRDDVFQQMTDNAVRLTASSRNASLTALVARKLRCGQIDERSPYAALFWVYWQQMIDTGILASTFALTGEYEVSCGLCDYKIDIVVCPSNDVGSGRGNPGALRLGVEIDGATHRNLAVGEKINADRRSRALQMAGWQVLPFSTQEFMNDPLACVQQVHTAATSRRIESLRRLVVESVAT